MYICILGQVKGRIPDNFQVSYPMTGLTADDSVCFQPHNMSHSRWVSVVPPVNLGIDKASPYSNYNNFPVVLFFYLVKVIVEGMGGPTQYMIQRFFAAKDDRECGMLSLFWVCLLSFRWPFIIAVSEDRSVPMWLCLCHSPARLRAPLLLPAAAPCVATTGAISDRAPRCSTHTAS